MKRWVGPPVPVGVCGTPGCTNGLCQIPFGKCHCGCEKDTPIAARTNRVKGVLKGYPRRFAYGHSNRQDFVQSSEARAKIAAAAEKQWRTTDLRARVERANRARWADPDFRRTHTGENSHRWRGGRYIGKRGYVYVWSPDHPLATLNGYVLEHRLVVERALGRTLQPVEVVHHRNGDTSDNRLENLELFPSQAEHQRLAHGAHA